jgi:hypothetical protein
MFADRARRPGGRLTTSGEEPTTNPRATTAECHWHFVEHMVCGDAGMSVAIEPQLGPGGLFAPIFDQGVLWNFHALTDPAGW